MVRYNVVAIHEGFTADSAFHILLEDFASQQFLHLCGRSAFAISPGMMRIVDALNTTNLSELFPDFVASAARQRLVNRAAFIGAEFHDGDSFYVARNDRRG